MWVQPVGAALLLHVLLGSTAVAAGYQLFSPASKGSSTGIVYDNLFKTVYAPLGYEACAQVGWLYLRNQLDCTAEFQRQLRDLQRQGVKPPPKNPPPETVMDLVLNGTIDFQRWYFNDAQTTSTSTTFTASKLEPHFAAARRREGIKFYKPSWPLIHDALDAFPIENLHAVVFGTKDPWVEAILVERGAASTLTIEYMGLSFEHPKMRALQPGEAAEAFLRGAWRPADVGVSFSSFEHSGLGRYGDPLDPWGDVKAMAQASCLIRPGGLLYLAVPISRDGVWWNAHRTYGPVRLPLLTANWKILDIFYSRDLGFGSAVTVELPPGRDGQKSFSHLWRNSGRQWDLQPIMVLQNTRGMPCRALHRRIRRPGGE